MAHIDNKKVDFVQRENESDCRTFRTGSIGEKEQHTSRFRRLTSGSLRHKSSSSQVPSIKTDFIEPVHNMDPLHTYFNSDTEVSDSGVPRINDNSYINNTRRPKRYRRSCRSPYETPNYSTALGPLREKHKLSPLERIFLEAAERGDKSTLIRCLSFSNGVNVNCVNMLGRTAIQIAVDNENIELVELLLEQPGIEIGDAILYAIQEGVYRIVEMLIDHPSITKEMLGTSWTTQCIGIGKREEESHDFSADISPVMLAAICNQFEILQLLINRGARIEEPHKSSCSCEHCHRLLTDDPLKHTLQRINTYKALASPAWISLTSPDPILTAFELSSELLHLASRENEFKETFLSLCEQCRKYACDLLDLCRGTGEVVAVLSKGTDSDESLSDVSSDESDDLQGVLKTHNLLQPMNHISTSYYSPYRQLRQTNRGHLDLMNNQSENNQSNANDGNDWRELLDRTYISKRRHHRRYTAWNHPSYSCAKFNQTLSIESSNHDEITGIENLHSSTSKNDELCDAENQFTYKDHLEITNDQSNLYSSTGSPLKFNDKNTTDSYSCNMKENNNSIMKTTSKEMISNESLPTMLITPEPCSSIFFKRKRNSFDWESSTCSFNQRIQSNTNLNTIHSKQTIYKDNKLNKSTHFICCCYSSSSSSYNHCKCSKSSIHDINANRLSINNNNKPNSHLETIDTSDVIGVRQQRKFYSFKLDRLKLAIKHEQKKFVAHPHCQHLLTTLWYDQLPGWRKRHPFTKLFLCFCFIIALPILAPTYLIHPHGCVGQLMRSPLIKFINHSASFAIFIFLLLIASTDTLTKTDLQRRSEIRGPDPNVIEMLILWWVIGFVWSEMKQIWEEGLKAYVRQWWNWLDFLMLGLYLTTVALRVVAVILRKTNQYGTEPLPRNQWPETDPTLLSEALFSIAHIFSFARIIFLFQINEHLGPLQISLGNMLIDITKFIFIFLLVISSFACGLHQLYYYYLSNEEDNRPRAFSSLVSSYRTLFWHLFGSSQSGNFEVTFVNKTSGERERMESARNTMVVGEILLLIYHAMAIIVLVNMLIAMMSNSFQTIQNHADTEWKFARSKLWVGYFDEGSTLPPPLNTIISPKSVIRFLCGIFHFIILLIKKCRNCKLSGNGSNNNNRHKQTKLNTLNLHSNQQKSQTEWDIEIQEMNRSGIFSHPDVMNKQKQQSIKETKQSKRKTFYQTVMRRLVRRYIHQSKKTMRQDGVNEDDLLEIKQDISSLRFEIREDRKREVVRAVCQLESLKQELVDELSKQNSILQNFVLPYTVTTTTSTTTTTTTSLTPNTKCTISSYQKEITSIQQTLPQSETELSLSVNIPKKYSLQHYNSMNNNNSDQILYSMDTKIKDYKKKYSLNYDKNMNHLTKMNEVLIDFPWLPDQYNKPNIVKGLYINDWYQFMNEIKMGLKEELISLIRNKYLLVNNEKLLNELKHTTNNDISSQIVQTPCNSLTNENKLDSFQTKCCNKHSEKIFPRFTQSIQSNYNFKRNSRQNDNSNNTEKIKPSHSKYPENIEEKSSCSTFKPLSSASSPLRSAVPNETLSSGLLPSSSSSRSHDQYLKTNTNKAMKNINISITSHISPTLSPTPSTNIATTATTTTYSSSSGHSNNNLLREEQNIDKNEGIIQIYETSNVHYEDDSSSSTINK
uniref:ANK_REP_REGION domain-containing protein n=1 Tax=Schistosoma mansoni TaxID=6183 RepID=A0A5K4FFE2_SCHMA